MAIKVIVDSTCDLAPEWAGIVDAIVPLTVYFGEEEYRDGLDLSKNDFYRKMLAGQLPKTSQPTPAAFADAYRKVRENGDCAVVITVSGQLSGTYQSAVIAAEGSNDIRVVDSRNAAIGSGILAKYAVDCINKGMELETLEKELLRVRDRIVLLAMVDNLEYLMKGGRLSRTAAFAGTLLNIKPVLTIREDAISVVGKARGSKKANNLLNEYLAKWPADYDMPILLGYTGCEDALLNQYVEDSKDLWEGKVDPLLRAQVGTVIGTHAGPGCYAVSYFHKA